MPSVEELKNDPLRPLIVDIGSNTFRLGFAGDDYPVIIVPSIYVEASDYIFASDVIDGLDDIFISEERIKKYFFGEEALKYKHILKIHEFKKEDNYNIFLKFFQYYYDKLEISAEYREMQPIIIIAPFLMTELEKSKLEQIFFNSFNFPKVLFLSESQAIMAPLQKISGVVVNMGESTTYINSFLHGFNKIMSRDIFPIAGKDLTNYLLNLCITQKESGKKNYVDNLIAKDIKEQTSLCVFNPELENKRIKEGVDKYDKEFVLPDGNSLIINSERFMLSEPLFNPRLIHMDYINIANAIANIVKSWERENWEELISNIILSGGASLIPGLKDRLKDELKKYFPDKINEKTNIIALSGREHMSWIGASILFLKDQIKKGWIANPTPRPPSSTDVIQNGGD
jgi:actin beta/gamma 1